MSPVRARLSARRLHALTERRKVLAEVWDRYGGVAERRGNGLQSRLHGFKSRLHLEAPHKWAVGAAVARFPDTEEVAGSIPVPPTSTKWPLTCGNACQGPSLSPQRAGYVQDGSTLETGSGRSGLGNFWEYYKKLQHTAGFAYSMCGMWSALLEENGIAVVPVDGAQVTLRRGSQRATCL